MLKLRVVLSFAVAVLVSLSTLDHVAAQASQADNEPSYTGSGDGGETAEPVVEEPPPEYNYTPSPTKTAANKASSGSGASSNTIQFPTGGGTVPQWGPCDANAKCAKHTYCKLLSSGTSICYPA